MAQVLKVEVRARIEAAALAAFADQGYAGTSMSQVAAAAGTAPANVYRYYANKEALFAAVVLPELPGAHDRLLDARIEALTSPTPDAGAADELLDFWLDHRLAVVVLLDRAEGTAYADYPESFVRRLVQHAERALPESLSAPRRRVLELVFDNTRRALAAILRESSDRAEVRELVRTFWSYQLPGLDGLLEFLRRA